MSDQKPVEKIIEEELKSTISDDQLVENFLNENGLKLDIQPPKVIRDEEGGIHISPPSVVRVVRIKKD